MPDSEIPQRSFASAMPSVRTAARWAPLRLCLLACIGLLSSSCDQTRIKAEEDALKAREAKLSERESAAAARDQEFEKQRQAVDEKAKALEQQRQALQQQQLEVDKAKAEIETQRKDLEALKQQAEAALEKVKREKAAAALAARRGPVPVITADRAIVIDPRTDEVLYQKNPDKKGPVASTQKLLTSLIIVESGNLDATVTVQQVDTECAPVRFGLKPGDQYTRKQLLTALLIHSFNDMAQALARDNAGSMEAFVERMNQRAAKLGMTNSHFVNPHGLPVEDQYSTARDMARIAKFDDTIPEIREIVCTKELQFQRNDGKIIKLENTNHVLRTDPNCDGMKTGFTEASGHCLVCSGQTPDGSARRIVVVLNDNLNVWKDAHALLEWALR